MDPNLDVVCPQCHFHDFIPVPFPRRQAFHEHSVIFFRDQPMTPEQHLTFARLWGPLHVHPAAPYSHSTPELMTIHTDGHSHRNNGEKWHSDVSADVEPPMGSILHIHKTPSVGGDTCFASMYAAYDALSEPLKNLLDPLTALHAASYEGWYECEAQRQPPRAVHPVVRVHPVTGRKALFVNSVFTKSIDGLSSSESEALLRFLFEHVANPNFQVRFRWREDSVAMWDNRCTQHMAVWDYWPEERRGIRVTVCGDQPQGPVNS